MFLNFTFFDSFQVYRVVYVRYIIYMGNNINIIEYIKLYIYIAYNI